MLAFSNNKQCFYLPGGKVHPTDTARQALCWEIEEEVHAQITEKDLEYYTHISAPAYGEPEGMIMEQDCFLLTKEIQPEAAADIGGLQLFSLKEYMAQAKRLPGAVMILQQLPDAGMIEE